MVNQIPLPKRSKHDPVTLDEAEAVKKWMKYNNMNIARLKKIMVAVEKNPLSIKEQGGFRTDAEWAKHRAEALLKKVSAKSKHNLRGKDGRFVAANHWSQASFPSVCGRSDTDKRSVE